MIWLKPLEAPCEEVATDGQVSRKGTQRNGVSAHEPAENGAQDDERAEAQA